MQETGVNKLSCYPLKEPSVVQTDFKRFKVLWGILRSWLDYYLRIKQSRDRSQTTCLKFSLFDRSCYRNFINHGSDYENSLKLFVCIVAKEAFKGEVFLIAWILIDTSLSLFVVAQLLLTRIGNALHRHESAKSPKLFKIPSFNQTL